MSSSTYLLRQAVDAARAGRRTEARELFMQVVDGDPRNEVAWMWLTGLVDDLEDKIIACENVLEINPQNEKVKAYLQKLLPQREPSRPEQADESPADIPPVQHIHIQSARVEKKGPNPLLQAEQLENEGRIDEALKAYELLAAKTHDSREFDHIYKQIIRLEGVKKENIQFVAPASSIMRMTFTWPLVYLSFALMQMGLNPVSNFSFFLWLGLPFVVAGSFLLALSEVRTQHVIWQKVFLEDGMGSGFARLVLGLTGWILVLLPLTLMLVSAWARLQTFEIPHPPF